MDFFIDNSPLVENVNTKRNIITEKKDNRPLPILDKLLANALKAKENGMDVKYSNKEMNINTKFSTTMDVCSDLRSLKKKQSNILKSESIVKYMKEQPEEKINKLMEKSVIQPGFETLHFIPRYDVHDRKLQEKRRKEREKTKGQNWFDLPATKVTPEIKRDLEVLKMRSVLDPKHFYKKNDLKVIPKYFQIGKVMDSPLDYYNNRCTKKERKRTLVDELLADAQFNKFNKRKYTEIIESRQKTHYKEHIKAKRLKKKHKK